MDECDDGCDEVDVDDGVDHAHGDGDDEEAYAVDVLAQQQSIFVFLPNHMDHRLSLILLTGPYEFFESPIWW